MELTLVSSNEGKLAEIREICRPYSIGVRWRRRSLVEPQTDDLATVVRAKLAQTRDIPGAVLVEDSGLFIPSLGGFPGVYSAHIYRLWGWEPILELLRHRSRTAEYRAVAGIRRGRTIVLGRGRCRGELRLSARGQGGFGFDPIFVPAGLRETFAEIPAGEKNRRSHRGRAIRAALRALGAGRSRP